MALKIALVGNPNCGKTTLFNELTGSSQYVGNWPGVTVDKKEGRLKIQGMKIQVVDLPGIYSLSPYTPEEVISRNYIWKEPPDLLINVVDATCMERNLYLTTQLMELSRPMMVVFNMLDVLESRGVKLDEQCFERKLGVPVCSISAARGTGLDDFKKKAAGLLKNPPYPKQKSLKNIHGKAAFSHVLYPVVREFYPWKINAAVEAIEDFITEEAGHLNGGGRFLAVKLFEDDPVTRNILCLSNRKKVQVDSIKESVPESGQLDRQMMIADHRYKFICALCEQAAIKRNRIVGFHTASDNIDRILTHRLLAIPIFLFIMLFIFTITFGPFGSSMTDMVDGWVNTQFAGYVKYHLESIGTADWLVGLVCDGIILGVGSVLAFLPQIVLLFVFLSVLEDSGYMSRAAFIMDRLLRKIGLSGRSFVPMLMGFGCTVPAVMATRTLENQKDKRLTILMTPYMSCQARMPVYALFIAAFFSDRKPLVIFSLYVLGMVVAVLVGLVMKNTVLKGEPASFVLEMPPYRLPAPKGLFIHVWERLKDFLIKAGTILLIGSVVIWFFKSFDLSFRLVEDSENSILAMLGSWLAPIFQPLGFGFWQAAVALMTGLLAKEQVVGAFGILFGAAGFEENVRQVALHFTPLTATSFLVFVLLYTPCLAAISTMSKEMRSMRWTLFSIALQLCVAWLGSFFVYQGGRWLGFT